MIGGTSALYPREHRTPPNNPAVVHRSCSHIHTIDHSSQQGLAAFHIDVRPERNAVRVVPAGELDLATVGELEAQLHELRDAGFEHVVLDLRALTFLDSAGIRLMLTEDRAARSSGRGFSLISGLPAIQRAFEACGLLGQLQFQSTGRGSALRVRPPGRMPAPGARSTLDVGLQRYCAELRHAAARGNARADRA